MIKKDKVLFWNDSLCIELDKKPLAKFLSARNLLTNENFPLYIPEIQVLFYNIYDVILTLLHELTCIQIYNDNVIRLHLLEERRPISIFINDNFNIFTNNFIFDLVIFSELSFYKNN